MGNKQIIEELEYEITAFKHTEKLNKLMKEDIHDSQVERVINSLSLILKALKNIEENCGRKDERNN